VSVKAQRAIAVVAAFIAASYAFEIWRHFSGAEPLATPRLVLKVILGLAATGYAVYLVWAAWASSARRVTRP
jgi:hypothetical protein